MTAAKEANVFGLGYRQDTYECGFHLGGDLPNTDNIGCVGHHVARLVGNGFIEKR
jgi:hypothetical protein